MAHFRKDNQFLVYVTVCRIYLWTWSLLHAQLLLSSHLYIVESSGWDNQFLGYVTVCRMDKPAFVWAVDAPASHRDSKRGNHYEIFRIDPCVKLFRHLADFLLVRPLGHLPHWSLGQTIRTFVLLILEVCHCSICHIATWVEQLSYLPHFLLGQTIAPFGVLILGSDQ